LWTLYSQRFKSLKESFSFQEKPLLFVINKVSSKKEKKFQQTPVAALRRDCSFHFVEVGIGRAKNINRAIKEE